MIKLRIEGELDKVQKKLVLIKKMFRVLSVSRTYQNRNSVYVRVYVEIE